MPPVSLAHQFLRSSFKRCWCPASLSTPFVPPARPPSPATTPLNAGVADGWLQHLYLHDPLPPSFPPLQVLLVGGFSASPYLQEKAKSGLRTEAAAPQVVVMEEPYAAVLQGASVCTGQRNGGRAC